MPTRFSGKNQFGARPARREFASRPALVRTDNPNRHLLVGWSPLGQRPTLRTITPGGLSGVRRQSRSLTRRGDGAAFGARRRSAGVSLAVRDSPPHPRARRLRGVHDARASRVAHANNPPLPSRRPDVADRDPPAGAALGRRRDATRRGSVRQAGYLRSRRAWASRPPSRRRRGRLGRRLGSPSRSRRLSSAPPCVVRDVLRRFAEHRVRRRRDSRRGRGVPDAGPRRVLFAVPRDARV